MNLLRRREVEKRVRRSTGALYADMRDGRFPRPIRIGLKAVAWVEADIEAWEKARIAERDAKSRAA